MIPKRLSEKNEKTNLPMSCSGVSILFRSYKKNHHNRKSCRRSLGRKVATTKRELPTWFFLPGKLVNSSTSYHSIGWCRVSGVLLMVDHIFVYIPWKTGWLVGIRDPFFKGFLFGGSGIARTTNRGRKELLGLLAISKRSQAGDGKEEAWDSTPWVMRAQWTSLWSPPGTSVEVSRPLTTTGRRSVRCTFLNQKASMARKLYWLYHLLKMMRFSMVSPCYVCGRSGCYFVGSPQDS